MKKQKTNKTVLTVKTGTVEEFFDNAKKVMRALDKKEPIKPSHTLVFTEPMEMLHFLSEKKMKLINAIRRQPDSITNIAKITKRNRAAVYRDIHEMERFGLVKTHEEINPGHGRHKIVELVAPALKLEAYI
jgi:predicted transcriptional regulator